MKFKIESSNITLKIVNELHDREANYIFNKDITVDRIIRQLKYDRFLSEESQGYYWRCYYNNKALGYSDKLITRGVYSGASIVFKLEELKEINVCINNVFSSDCDVDVPLDATVGDVIARLIDCGFLYAETVAERITLCSVDYECIDIQKGIFQGTEYYNRNRTIGEYNWQPGQVIVAVRTCVAYGCPTAKDLPGLLPECMISKFDELLLKTY